MGNPKQNTQGYSKQNRTVIILFYIILGAGITLRLYQHLMGRSLWEDEAHIALNFMKFGYAGLMAPLENYQTAPILFLWITDTFCSLFGPGEVSLRSFAFIVSLAALPFYFYMVKDFTGNVLTALIAFTIFALNISLIYYSSEVKSYTIDVAVYVLILYLLFSVNKYVLKHRTLLLAITGCLFILCSNASVVVLFCAAIYMITSGWGKGFSEDRKILRVKIPSAHLVIFGSWAVVWLLNFFVFIYNHPYSEGMKNIWSWTFAPSDVFSKEFADFIKLRIDDTIYMDMLFFTDKFYFPQVLTGLIIVAVGYCIYTRRWKALWLTAAPILLHLVLSMFKVYPFFYRFILYLLPPFIILTAIGISTVVRIIAERLHRVIAVPVALFFLYCCTYISIQKFPYWDREIGPVLSFINKNYPDKPIMVTTPFTLYSYYMERGIAKNKNLIPIKWQLKPDEYYNDELIKSRESEYLLLYSVDGWADGYGDVLNSLKENNLIINQFEYKTYGVAEIKPKK